MLILLSFLLKQHKVWSNCTTRVFTVARILVMHAVLPVVASTLTTIVSVLAYIYANLQSVYLV